MGEAKGVAPVLLGRGPDFRRERGCTRLGTLLDACRWSQDGQGPGRDECPVLRRARHAARVVSSRDKREGLVGLIHRLRVARRRGCRAGAAGRRGRVTAAQGAPSILK